MRRAGILFEQANERDGILKQMKRTVAYVVDRILRQIILLMKQRNLEKIKLIRCEEILTALEGIAGRQSSFYSQLSMSSGILHPLIPCIIYGYGVPGGLQLFLSKFIVNIFQKTNPTLALIGLTISVLHDMILHFCVDVLRIAQQLQVIDPQPLTRTSPAYAERRRFLRETWPLLYPDKWSEGSKYIRDRLFFLGRRIALVTTLCSSDYRCNRL